MTSQHFLVEFLKIVEAWEHFTWSKVECDSWILQHLLAQIWEIYIFGTTSSSGNMPKLNQLYLSNNFITEIPKFVDLGFGQLSFLDLTRNKVKNVNVESFNGLRNLRNLYLEYNEIETFNFTIADESFLPNLVELSLNGNQITSFDIILPANVTGIRFQNNKLTYLKTNSIQPISQLRYLNVDNNEIRKIDSDFFNDAINLTVYMENNHCFSDQIIINDRDDLEQKTPLLEKCFNHATNSVLSIGVLLASVFVSIIFKI